MKKFIESVNFLISDNIEQIYKGVFHIKID